MFAQFFFVFVLLKITQITHGSLSCKAEVHRAKCNPPCTPLPPRLLAQIGPRSALALSACNRLLSLYKRTFTCSLWGRDWLDPSPSCVVISCVTLASLFALLCKIETITIPLSWGYNKEDWVNVCEALRTEYCSPHRKYYRSAGYDLLIFNKNKILLHT